jgi:hypothetical protein
VSGEVPARRGVALTADGVDRSDPLGARLRRMRESGELELPMPGRGRTRARWAALAGWGRADLQLARLAEGHTDAVAVLAEAGLRPAPEACYGVWAARPGGVGPRVRNGLLRGELRFCSGADVLDRALVVADPVPPVDGPVLVEVAGGHPDMHPVPASWRADAMAGTHTWTMIFDDVPVVRPVGGPGWYTDRRGFALGGAGVAAVWWGAAAGLLDRALAHVPGPDGDPHRHAHLGELHAVLAACRALVDRTADQVDTAADADHRVAVATLRSAVEHGCRELLDRLPRVLGPAAWSGDGELAAQLADLQMYLRQHHGERDHAELAHLLTPGPASAR